MLHTKFQLNGPSGSKEEVENAKKSNGQTDRRRTTGHDISSPGPKGPGELKIYYKTLMQRIWAWLVRLVKSDTDP